MPDTLDWLEALPSRASVCLQFPDGLLPAALDVHAALAAAATTRGWTGTEVRSRGAGLEGETRRKESGKGIADDTPSSSPQFYVLADSTFNPASPDELAADHVAGDALIHYGPAALDAAPARLPVRFVLAPRVAVDVPAVAEAVKRFAESLPDGVPGVVLLPSQGAAWAAPALAAALAGVPSVAVAAPAADVLLPGQAPPPPPADVRAPAASAALGGLTWRPPAGAPPAAAAYAWLGDPPPEGDVPPPLDVLRLALAASPAWVAICPASATTTPLDVSAPARVLSRRYFAVQKAANAAIVAVVLTTGAGAEGVAAADAVAERAAAAGKTVYRLALGRPTPPKLANFAEVGAFVLVAPPGGQLLPCWRDVGVPVLTPAEAALAFGDADPVAGWDAGGYKFPTLREVAALGGGEGREAGVAPAPRFSLVDGGLHGDGDGGVEGLTASTTTDLATRHLAGLALSNPAGKALAPAATAAEFLATRRAFTGLPTPATGAPVKAAAGAVAGRGGTAAGYEGEGEA